MKKTSFSAMVLVLGLSAIPAHAAVWATTQQWTPAAESQYEAWLKANLDVNIFNRPGPLQGVTLDCADAVYSMRMLFSFQQGLPFVIKDPTSGNATISSGISKFDNVQAGAKRFRAFAQYVYGLTDTESLPEDSYPPSIDRESIPGGAFMRTDPASHHSWTIGQVDQTGIPHLFFASRPARTTLFERDYIPSMGFMFPHGNPASTEAGFRRWRHPEDILKPEWQVPGYSLEQYQIPIGTWIATVQQKLQVVAETPEQHVVRMLGIACQETQDRVTVVNQAIAYLGTMGSRQCMNEDEFNDYSTPSKDQRLHDEFQELADAYASSGNGAQLSPDVNQQASAVLEGEASAQDPNGLGYCPVAVSGGETLTLGQVYARSLGGKLSSNPLDPIEMRWGDQQGPSQRASSCPSY